MTRDQIRQIIDRTLPGPGLIDTPIPGLRLFRVTEPVPCTPAVYEPSVVAILEGRKEAILDGTRHVYDHQRYMCCPMSLPVEAGTPHSAPDRPLVGVMLALDPRKMSEVAVEMERAGRPQPGPATGATGLALARWDARFSDALLRLLQLIDTPVDCAVLQDGRLRELYYAILTGEAGTTARRAFGVGNDIARTIRFLSANLAEPVSIDDMAAQAGMSRAVFHRKFKQATTMSPIQFAKSMRLNQAAMQIAGGKTVSEAAWDVGYVSASQFSRDFKRLYGQSPRQWGQTAQVPIGAF